MLDPPDEVGPQVQGLAVALEIGQPGEDLGEEQAKLHTGQVGADAEVRTAPGDLPACDALLGPLADNFGPTLTHLPAPASPLANAGDNASCPLEDQRGFLRNVGPANGCDIGSVEFSVPEPAATSLGAASLLALAALRRSSSRA